MVLLDANMLGMDGMAVRSLLRLELGIEHHVTGAVDVARIRTDLQVQKARNRSDQAFEAVFQELQTLALPLAQVPDDTGTTPCAAHRPPTPGAYAASPTSPRPGG